MASVYQKNRKWYLRVKDASGRWHDTASAAASKTEAKRLKALEDENAKLKRLLAESIMLRLWAVPPALPPPTLSTLREMLGKNF